MECRAASKVGAYAIQAEAFPSLRNAALNILLQIKDADSKTEVPSAFEFTALTYLAGYLAFVCEEKANALMWHCVRIYT